MPRAPRSTLTAAELDELIEPATVDCYNDSEQVTGLFTMIEEHLDLPFDTTVLGVPVTVARVDVTTDGSIVAICARDGRRQTIPILDLPRPDPTPDGWEWVEACGAAGGGVARRQDHVHVGEQLSGAPRRDLAVRARAAAEVGSHRSASWDRCFVPARREPRYLGPPGDREQVAGPDGR